MTDPDGDGPGDAFVDARREQEPGPELSPDPPLTGRDHELSAALERLAPGRVLTVVGGAGIGKTALASAVAAASADDFDDVWRCELAAVHDGEAMTAEIARTVGAIHDSDADTLDALVTALDGRRALVVLDHLDQIAGQSAGVVARLLSACRGLALLATSAVPLGIGDETSIALGPLDDPRDGGNPLAIRLSASLARPTPAEESESAGSDRLTPVLHSVVETLDPTECRVFERVSVFRGSFDEGAARVALGSEAAVRDVGLLLDRLADLSLLRRRAGRRWDMPESIRQFADRRLAERGERAAVRNTHLELLVDRTASAAAASAGRNWREGLATFRSLWPDLRAAVQWAIDAQRAADVDQLLRQTYFVARWTLDPEPTMWARRALGRVDATGVPAGAPAHLLDALGASLAGDRVASLAAVNRAIEAPDATPGDRSWARLDGAADLLSIGQTAEAAAMADDMVGGVPPRAVEQAIQGSAHLVVKVWARQMAMDDAFERAERARLVAEATQSPVAIGQVEYHRGLLLALGGDASAAAAVFRRVLEIGRSDAVTHLVVAALPLLVGVPGREGLLAALDAIEYGRDSTAVGHEFVVLDAAGINLTELGQVDAAAVVLGHLEAGGRRSPATVERREAAMEALASQRRSRRLMDKGAAMSRAEVWEFTEDRLRRALDAS